MKTELPEESKIHEHNIRNIANIIKDRGGNRIAFIILFGSFARGDWVHEFNIENNAVHRYASDYDFLVITKKGNTTNNHIYYQLDREINKALDNYRTPETKHSHSIIIEPLKKVNKMLEKGQYFFSDIKKEGILLYSSGEFELSEAKELTQEEQKKITQNNFDFWFEDSLDFVLSATLMKEREKNNKAAFNLHQATEGLLHCTLLTFVGRKEKTHDLTELLKLCSRHSNKFQEIFPLNLENEKKCFQLLQDAYIKARYDKNYKISEEQLNYLEERIGYLKETVNSVCKDHIENIISKN